MNFEPKWIAWEITRRCNLNCVHCRSSSELEIAGHPDCSLDEAKRMLDDIKSYADPVMVLSGGEPLLRSDVFDIASYGTDLGLRMCLATNGTLVTEETCRNIKESGIKMVSLGLDGFASSLFRIFGKILSFSWSFVISKGIKIIVGDVSTSMAAAAAGPALMP